MGDLESFHGNSFEEGYNQCKKEWMLKIDNLTAELNRIDKYKGELDFFGIINDCIISVEKCLGIKTGIQRRMKEES